MFGNGTTARAQVQGASTIITITTARIDGA
jgi:ornithine cyclodeaminase/alanine dehydrogenase-like protein (mu-crystallin family)